MSDITCQVRENSSELTSAKVFAMTNLSRFSSLIEVMTALNTLPKSAFVGEAAELFNQCIRDFSFDQPFVQVLKDHQLRVMLVLEE